MEFELDKSNYFLVQFVAPPPGQSHSWVCWKLLGFVCSPLNHAHTHHQGLKQQMLACECVSLLDNEWELLRPSTAGRRLRVSDVTRVLSAPQPFVNSQDGFFFSLTFVCMVVVHFLYCGHK